MNTVRVAILLKVVDDHVIGSKAASHGRWLVHTAAEGNPTFDRLLKQGAHLVDVPVDQGRIDDWMNANNATDFAASRSPTGGKDSVVDELVESHITRALMGRQKYGVTMDRDDIDLEGWVQHTIEELMDAAVYLTRIKQELQYASFPTLSTVVAQASAIVDPLYTGAPSGDDHPTGGGEEPVEGESGGVSYVCPECYGTREVPVGSASVGPCPRCSCLHCGRCLDAEGHCSACGYDAKGGQLDVNG